MTSRVVKLGLAGLTAYCYSDHRYQIHAEEVDKDAQEKFKFSEQQNDQIKSIKVKETLKDKLVIPEDKLKADQIKDKSENAKGAGETNNECILVVGTTGTGKSSTISKYTGEKIFVSDKASSATRSCMAVKDSRGPQHPVWVDTIGYDDTYYLADSDSFKELLKFLCNERLLKVKAIIWTVGSQERKDARLRKQADFINQFKDVDIWDNVIILVKQPGSFNLQKASQGAHEAAKYYAGECSNIQILGFTYLDDKIPAENLAKLRELSEEERKERLLVTDEELVKEIDSALNRIERPVQVIFEDSECLACGIIGDKRLLPDFCHLEQSFVHRGQLRHYHPNELEPYHPLSLEAYHPGVLKLTGGPSRTCETVRNYSAVLTPVLGMVDLTMGVASAITAGSTAYLCSQLDRPFTEIFSCCKADRLQAGCQVQYSCCKRREENKGCCYTYSCCNGGSQAAGCLRRYDCCGREESATGCLSICRKCGQPWGTAAGQCYRTGHQLVSARSQSG